VLGFLFSAAAAFLLGTLISQVRLIELTLFPYVVAIQTLPKIAVAPLVLI
jgi:NitT/TauT family transport system permease protein